MERIKGIIKNFFLGDYTGKIVIGIAFAIFLKMVYDLLGFEYWNQTMDEMTYEIGANAIIGELIPIDFVTLFLGAIVVALANYGMKRTDAWMKLAKVAKWGAVALMVLSFTPVYTFIPMLSRMLVQVEDETKIRNSQEDYEEFAQYINVSNSIALTNGATKAEIQAYLENNLTELGKQELKSVEAEEIRDYVQITLKFNDTGKTDFVYHMGIEELEYPEAYFQMVYNEKTVLGCKEELNFNGKFEFGDVTIKYPSMMYYALNGVDTVYAGAEDANGNYFDYTIYFDSTSMYKTFAPYLSWEIPSESQMSSLPDYCKDMVYEAVRFLPGNGSQTVNTSETIVVNDITMQKATGVLTGSEYGGNGEVVTYNYIAYYFFVEEDGEMYPAVMIGVSTGDIMTDLDEKMSQMAEHISR